MINAIIKGISFLILKPPRKYQAIPTICFAQVPDLNSVSAKTVMVIRYVRILAGSLDENASAVKEPNN
jgi:hypothetical protein